MKKDLGRFGEWTLEQLWENEKEEKKRCYIVLWVTN